MRHELIRPSITPGSAPWRDLLRIDEAIHRTSVFVIINNRFLAPVNPSDSFSHHVRGWPDVLRKEHPCMPRESQREYLKSTRMMINVYYGAAQGVYAMGDMRGPITRLLRPRLRCISVLAGEVPKSLVPILIKDWGDLLI